MSTPSADHALLARIPRTWSAFFARFGSFTAAQRAAIPPLLDGDNVMLCAPTAGGKTEAALAPLVERYCDPRDSPAGLRILYLTPTRALINDLERRLQPPLSMLGLRLGVRSGDTNTLRATRPPDILITTPESLDSLLTSNPRLFARLRAVVIDEAHLFEGTPRADHLAVLLARLRRIRAYAAGQGDAPDDATQYAALSATVADPAALAARYFADARIVQVPRQRVIMPEWLALDPDSAHGLLDYFKTFRARGWRKALVFCNSRAEVEAYATATRDVSPFGEAVFAHYSNIDTARRREIEARFNALDVALCFASSTLELGIDIGDIDLVMMIGPPGSVGAFVQRAGRGNRRGTHQHVTCAYRSPYEHATFAALLAALDGPPAPTVAAFRPSVAIQQIFSLLKQSPTGSVRLPELAALFVGLLEVGDIATILGHLRQTRFLRAGRPGEWRSGERLDALYDEQIAADVSLSIYSNIQHTAGRTVEIRDQLTHAVVARVDAQWFDRPVLTLEGRAVHVAWSDGAALWVNSYRGGDAAQRLIYRSAKQLLSLDIAQQFAAQFGLAPHTAPYIATDGDALLFHWLGDVYGRAFFDLLRPHVEAEETTQPALCVLVRNEPVTLPTWTAEHVRTYLHENHRRYEALLDLGPFHHLLPLDLQRRAVIEQFDIPRFIDAANALHPVVAPESLNEDLHALIAV